MIVTSLFSLKNPFVLNFVCFLPQNGTSQQTGVVLSYVIYVSHPGDESFTAIECSWMVLECAPLEHWGIKHEPAPHLISGPRGDFVLLQPWFCSGFSFHAASVLLISSRVVVLAAWTRALLNQIISSSAPQQCHEPEQTGSMEDGSTLGRFQSGPQNLRNTWVLT